MKKLALLYNRLLPIYIPKSRRFKPSLHIAIWNGGTWPQTLKQSLKSTQITLRKNYRPVKLEISFKTNHTAGIGIYIHEANTYGIGFSWCNYGLWKSYAKAKNWFFSFDKEFTETTIMDVRKEKTIWQLTIIGISIAGKKIIYHTE